MPELIPAEPGTPAWLAARRAGVTATDIVTILGLSHWDSVYSLFWRKMQQAPEVEDNDRFRLGRALEGYVADLWDERVEREHIVTPGGLYRHSERTWQMATLDREARPYGEVGGSVPLELKTWADGDRHSWGAGIYTGRVGDDGERLDPLPPLPAELTIPAQVRAQVLWQMDVMDVSVGHVGVVFLPSGEFRSYTIEHDPASDCACLRHITDVAACSVCKDLELMRAAGGEFMARLRLELPPPDPDASAATLAAVRARFTRQPDKQAEVSKSIWNAWYGAKTEAQSWTDLVRKYEILLREEAGEADVYTVDGQPVARRIIVDADVKAHHRHQDYLKRIEPRGDDSE
jgi:hypothetical protein